jgi:nicotinate-nucleotide--dimethylbenzimidazole phosphoribosyltransferase
VADHDVAAAGVTAQALAAVSALARAAGADVLRVGLEPTRDPSAQAALTTPEVAAAVDCGRELARAAAADGITLLAGGAIGIGSTAPATALACWLTGRPPSELTEPDQAAVVERALALHRDDIRGPLGALRRLGGGEICVLAGLALGAGEQGLGFVCDGLTATAAAAVAAAIEPDLRPRLLAGHRSPEPAHGALLEHLGLEPVLDLRMRLGDGSGASAALAVLRLAAATATFAEAGV